LSVRDVEAECSRAVLCSFERIPVNSVGTEVTTALEHDLRSLIPYMKLKIPHRVMFSRYCNICGQPCRQVLIALPW